MNTNSFYSFRFLFYSFLPLLVLPLFFSTPLKAQRDTIKVNVPAVKDTLYHAATAPKNAPIHTAVPEPRKVARASLFLPGYGQTINQKEWKVPLVYITGAALGCIVVENQRQYRRYNTAYQNRIGNIPGDPALNQYAAAQLSDRQNHFLTDRNLAIAGIAALYLGNVFDAYRDAHKRSTGHRLFYFTESHPPKKAAAYSAMLPGLGQAYNRKYWKIPLIYAAGAGLGWFFWYEQGNFDFYTRAYHIKLDPTNPLNQTEPLLINRSVAYLLEEKNYFNRYRDLSIIGLTAWYVLNVVDAAVDAHFWHFDQNIDDNLGFHLTPVCMPVYGSIYPAPGLRASLRLR